MCSQQTHGRLLVLHKTIGPKFEQGTLAEWEFSYRLGVAMDGRQCFHIGALFSCTGI